MRNRTACTSSKGCFPKTKGSFDFRVTICPSFKFSQRERNILEQYINVV
jgi:hypothetical protein